MPPDTPLIHLSGVTFRYPGASLNVLDDLNLKLYRGERMGLIAPNGSGKTTLLHIMMGLLKPDSGTIRLFGKPVSEEKDFQEVRPRVGLLFQDSDDQLFSPTVLEDVAFGPLNLGKSKEDAVDIASRTLADLGLAGFEDRITIKLSGGEKRLVALATVLAMQPEVLLLDEPINGLDTATQERIGHFLAGLDLSYIIISHDLDFLTPITASIYTMQAGKIFLDDKLHIHEHVHAHPHGRYPHRHE
jgi:cobalt/nickel transport system ATP-binding protein